MGDQLDFGFADPPPSERTTLAPVPSKAYTAPRLLAKPPSFVELWARFTREPLIFVNPDGSEEVIEP